MGEIALQFSDLPDFLAMGKQAFMSGRPMA